MRQKETSHDLRSLGFSALKKASISYLWKLQEAKEDKEKNPPEIKDLQTFLKKQLDTIRLSELMAMPHLFDRINKFLEDIPQLHDFIDKQRDKIHKIQLVGYNSVHATVSNKYTIELPVDFLYTKKVGKGYVQNLIVFCSPFDDLEVYKLLTTLYTKAFKDNRIELNDIYLINFDRSPVRISAEIQTDHLQTLEVLLGNLYDTYMVGRQPIAEYYQPVKMKICYDCIYANKCRGSTRLDLLDQAHITADYK
jgi:hypothetical protein